MTDVPRPSSPSRVPDPWGELPAGPPMAAPTESPAPAGWAAPRPAWGQAPTGWEQQPGQPQPPGWGQQPGWEQPPGWGQPQGAWYGAPDAGIAVADPRRWGIGDIFWGLGIMLLASTLLSIPLIVAPSPSTTMVTVLGALGTWAGFLGWPLYCSWVKGIGTLRADFQYRMEWYDLFIGVGVAFGAMLVNGLLTFVEQQAGAGAESNTQILSDAKGSSVGVIVVSMIAVIGAPLIEELFFRGLVFGAVEKRYNRWAGFVVSTLLFTVLHAQPADDLASLLLLLLHIGVIGAALGLARLFTGRCGAGIVAHMTVNGLATLVVLSGALGG